MYRVCMYSYEYMSPANLGNRVKSSAKVPLPVPLPGCQRQNSGLAS